MSAVFAVIAFTILASAAVAMSLRNLIHSALLLVVSWAGVALFYLWAGAEFAAFAQALIYVGAISMVVLFAVLLTRASRDPAPPGGPPKARRMQVFTAALVGAAVAGVLAAAVLATPGEAAPAQAPSVTVHELGALLMGRYAAALVVIGVMLTVALLGAVVIAATDGNPRREDAP